MSHNQSGRRANPTSVEGRFEHPSRLADPGPRFPGFRVCPTCCRIYGAPPEAPGHRQFCQCTPEEIRSAQAQWADVHCHWDFCWCCGMDVRPASSRWSLYFDEICQGAVRQLNQQARGVIPIGRHSMQSGAAWTPGAEDVLEAFADRLIAFVEATENLERYGTGVVAERFHKAGFRSRQGPTLDAFLDHVRRKEGPREQGTAIARLLLAAVTGDGPRSVVTPTES